MQKSLSTQIAATVFFGPMGLAYTSMAVAVFFTLLLAVLIFTELGILSVLLIWPLSIIIGMLLVKLNNDQHRHHGRLLLAPEDEDGSLIGAVSSGGRAFVAICALALLGTFAIWFSSGKKNDVSPGIGRIVDSPAKTKTEAAVINPTPANANATQVASQTNNFAGNQSDSPVNQNNNTSKPVESLPVAKTTPVIKRQQVDLSQLDVETTSTAPSQPDSVVVPIPESVSPDSVSVESEGQSVLVPIASDELKVVVLDQQQVTPVVIDSSSPSNIKVTASNFLYVNEQLANLRGGPGTSNPILARLTRGEQMTELDRQGSWIRVTTTDENITGWIFSSLVSDELR